MKTMKENKKDIIHSAIGKVKMVDAGKKMGMEMSASVKSKKNEVYYPSISIDTKQCPDMKGMEVDQDINMVIKGKIVSHSVDESPDRSNESFRIEMRKIGLMSK